MLRLTALILLFIGGLQGYGQDWKGYYQAEIGGGVTADRLPFWLHTNIWKNHKRHLFVGDCRSRYSFQ
mgnify:CR=1 FL=1